MGTLTQFRFNSALLDRALSEIFGRGLGMGMPRSIIIPIIIMSFCCFLIQTIIASKKLEREKYFVTIHQNLNRYVDDGKIKLTRQYSFSFKIKRNKKPPILSCSFNLHLSRSFNNSFLHFWIYKVLYISCISYVCAYTLILGIALVPRMPVSSLQL